jgi:8-oxo-dGTP pyrophosphatase MutT (NUDIX family)
MIEPLRAKASEPTPAAVLIGLVEREQGLCVLLTERTAHLHDHAGQISFPGGRVEPEDIDAHATALRETEEEIGLTSDYIEVLGTLPTYVTGTGFSVVPVVALVRTGFTLKPDAFEVAEVFEVPLAFLMDPGHHETRRASVGEVVRQFYTMPYGSYFIWGATAAMLRNLYAFLASAGQ